ncbi:MAG: hypothetical protein IPL06_19185 [Betaproteobacteria bacterium]|nr:hypothetical protein [Betaproteobacteria bacterium]
MGSLSDQLKHWKSRGKAQVESLERAKAIAAKLPPRAAVAQSQSATKTQSTPSQPLNPPLPAPSATAKEAPAVTSFETSGFRPLGKPEHYKHPDEWIDLGCKLQPPGFAGGRALTVRVGIDFGTAYTKVAINAAGTVFLVDWSGVTLSGERYFLPGVVSVLHGGATFLGRCSKSAGYLSDLEASLSTGPA